MLILITLISILSLTFLKYLFTKPVVSSGLIFNVIDLVNDGSQIFLKRLSSISVQLIIYILIAFLGISYAVFDTYIISYYITFVIGFSSLLLGHFSVLYFIKRILLLSSQFLKLTRVHSLRSYLQLSFSIMIMMIFPVLLSLLAVIQWFNSGESVTFLLGVLLGVFFLRVGGGIFRSSSEVAKIVVNRVENSYPQDHRNPVSYLDFIGQFIGNVTGFSADIMAAFAMVFVSLFFAMPYFNDSSSYMANIVILEKLPFLLLLTTIISSFIAFTFSYIRVVYYAKNILLETIYIAMAISMCISYLIFSYAFDQNVSSALFLVYALGVFASIVIAYLSDLFSSVFYVFGKKTLSRSEMGPALILFQNMVNAFIGNGFLILVLFLVVFLSVYLFGLVGLSVMSFAFLSSMPLLISSKVFLNLTDLTSRIESLDSPDDDSGSRTSFLTQIGRTINPVGSGFSAVSAILSSLCLVLLASKKISLFSILFLSKYTFILCVFLGIVVALFFLGFMMSGFTSTVSKIRLEMIRQFREIPYLLEGKSFPDVLKIAQLHTILSLRVLTWPIITLVLSVLIVLYIFGLSFYVPLFIGISLVILLHVFYWAILGDSVQQAKQHIEFGYQGGQKGSSFQYMNYAFEYSSIYSMVLGPNYLVILKCLSVLFAVLFI